MGRPNVVPRILRKGDGQVPSPDIAPERLAGTNLNVQRRREAGDESADSASGSNSGSNKGGYRFEFKDEAPGCDQVLDDSHDADNGFRRGRFRP
jgi:hypothetical protein